LKGTSNPFLFKEPEKLFFDRPVNGLNNRFELLFSPSPDLTQPLNTSSRWWRRPNIFSRRVVHDTSTEQWLVGHRKTGTPDGDRWMLPPAPAAETHPKQKPQARRHVQMTKTEPGSTPGRATFLRQERPKIIAHGSFLPHQHSFIGRR
jgi:hypothetical protein